MNPLSRSAAPVLFLLAAAGLVWAVAHPHAAPAAAPAAPGTARQSVQLTVYAEDFALVREVRPVTLASGRNHLQLSDVSKQLDPESVLLRWGGGASALPQIVAHAYDMGVGGGDQLLKRYLGQTVTLVRYGSDGHESERQSGTLMHDAGGVVVLQSEGNFYVNPPGTLVVPTQSGVVTLPQLSVQADSPAAQGASLDVAYLTRGLSWDSDYVATLTPGGNSLSLECWATVTNRTGTDYPNASVTLIAGSPNRAVRQAQSLNDVSGFSEARAARPAHVVMRPQLAAPNLAGGAPTTVGDFHAYKLQSPTTVVQDQMNRLLLFRSPGVPVKKDYNGSLPALSSWDYDEGGAGNPPQRGNVALGLTFFNKVGAGLGVPLPSGALRLYEPDATGALRYAGAAQIENTPQDQKVSVTLDTAFDVFTERRVLKVQKLGKHQIRKQVEVVVHNEQAAPVTVRLVQTLEGRWKVAGESAKHVNLDSSRAQWSIPVPARGQTRLLYTVDFTV